MNISVQTTCPYCLQGDKPRIRRVLKPWYAFHIVERFSGGQDFAMCSMFDSELRHAGESLGFYEFAWKPVQCRNGKWRWLRTVERHDDKTYSLGNRAH
jgi:hypothetical protein